MRSARRTLVHLDLYRVRDAGELEHLGLRDWAQPGHLWLIEWPERGAGRLPASTSARLQRAVLPRTPSSLKPAPPSGSCG